MLMGFVDSARGFYFSVEDKYYNFLDWLDRKGVPVYKAVDVVESKGMPSFPFALIFLLLVASGFWFLLLPLLLAPQAVLVTIAVSDFADNAAIENAVVTLTYNGEQKFGSTNRQGETSFLLPIGKEVTAKSEKQDYRLGQLSFPVSRTDNIKSLLMEKTLKTIKKVIQLTDAKTGSLIEKPLTVKFICSSTAIGELGVKTSERGKIGLDVPENCGTLRAELLGTGKLEETILDPKEAVSVLKFQEKEVETGSADVTVVNETKNAVAGVKVRLLSADGIEQNAKFAGTSGAVRFDDVPTGTYYVVVHDDTGKYKTFNGSGEKKSIIAKQATQFSVALQQAILGKIKVVLKDVASGAPVANAVVNLQRDNVVLNSTYSSAQGRAEFNVTENVSFDIVADHPEYLLAVLKNISHKETDNEILLKRATADIANKLFVKVVDPLGKPIENAQLLLKRTDNTVAVSGKATGADGQAEFPNLPSGETFVVFAAKKGFAGKESQPVKILPRQENRVTIVLDIGTGTIQLKVVDDTGAGVSGAAVKAFEIGKTTELRQQLTDLSGQTEFSARADLEVFFVVTASGFLPFTTSKIPVDAGATKQKTITLQKKIEKTEVEFLGLFIGNASAAGTLSPGQAYTARLVLKLPGATAPFNEGGIHFRVGKAENDATSIVEEDTLYIGDVLAGTTSIAKGASYTPPRGHSIDSRRLTSGAGKWADIVWKQAGAGVFEAEAIVVVKDNAVLGEQLQLWYRGWARKDKFDRHPLDAELSGNENTPNKQALYANALLAQYSVGPSNLCSAGYCKSFIIEDTAKGSRTFVTNFFPAIISKDYRLGFTISKTREGAEENAEIVFSSEQNGLRFGAFSITGAHGKTSTGVSGTGEVRTGIGSLSKDSVVFGTVDFRTISDGLNTLRIRIISKNREVFNEIIDVSVEPALALEIDTVPQEIVPLIDNDVLVRVKDEEKKPAVGALVKAFLNNTLISSRETNAKGEAAIRIESPPTGSTVKIVAQKLGFKEATLTIKVDDSILFVSPPEITQALSLTEFFKEIDIVAKNRSAIALTVTDINFSDTFDELVSFKATGSIVGEELAADSDANFSVQIELTEKAFSLRQAQRLKGEMTIIVFSPELSRTFATNIPINIRIGLGQEVDDEKCLLVEPATAQFFSDSNQGELTVKLTNNCRVRKKPIALRLLQVKLDTKNQNQLGKFKLESKKAGFESVTVTENFQTIAPVFEGGESAEFSLSFSPNKEVKAGEAKPEIVFQSVNQTPRQVEEIQARIKTEVKINDLTKCVEVKSPPVIFTEVAPFNLGYGAYNEFGLYPQASVSNPSYGIPAGGTVSGLTGGGLSYAFPSASYTNPFFSRAFDTNADQNFSYYLGTSSFSVKNNCTIPVDIEIDSGPFIRTDKTSLALELEKEETVQVQSGNRVGRFEIKVKAKRAQTQDKPKEIKRIPVIVRSLDEIGENCISLSSTIFRFGYGGIPLQEQIINRCYDIGVRLASTDDVIKITCNLPGAQRPGTIGRQVVAPAIQIKTETVDVARLQFPGTTGYTYPTGTPPYGTTPVGAQGYNPYYSGSGYYGSNPYQNYFGGTTGQYYNPTAGTGYYNAPVYGGGNYNYLGAGRGQYYPYSYGSGYPGLGAQEFATGTPECQLIENINILDKRVEPLAESRFELDRPGPRLGGLGGTLTEVVDFEITPNISLAQPPITTPFGAPGQGIPPLGTPFGAPQTGLPFGPTAPVPPIPTAHAPPIPGTTFPGTPGALPGYGLGLQQTQFPGAYPAYPGAQFPGGALGIFPGQTNPYYNYFNPATRASGRVRGAAHIKFVSPAGQIGIEKIRVLLEPPFFPSLLPPWMQPPYPPRDGRGDGDDGRDGDGDDGRDGRRDGDGEIPGGRSCVNQAAFDTVSYWRSKGSPSGSTASLAEPIIESEKAIGPTAELQRRGWGKSNCGPQGCTYTSPGGRQYTPQSPQHKQAQVLHDTGSTKEIPTTQQQPRATPSIPTTQQQPIATPSGSGLGFTPQNRFKDNKTEWKPGEDPRDSAPLLGAGVECAAATVSDAKTDYTAVDSVKIDFKLADNKKNIHVLVDRSGMTKKCVDITASVSFEEFLPIASPDLTQMPGVGPPGGFVPPGGAPPGGAPGGAPPGGAPPTAPPTPNFNQGRFCGATTGARFSAGLAALMIERAKAERGLTAELQGKGPYTGKRCPTCPGNVYKVYDSANKELPQQYNTLAQAQVAAQRLNQQQGFVPGQPQPPRSDPRDRPAPQGPPFSGQREPTPPGQGFIDPNSNNAKTPPGTGFGGQYGQGQRNRLQHSLQATIRIYKPDLSKEEIDKIKDIKDCEKAPIKDENQPIVQPGVCELPGAYKTLGFDKLSFDWEWGSINELYCDEGSDWKFCDGAQHSVEMLQKGGRIKRVTLEAYNASKDIMEKSVKEKMRDFMNSKESWRFAKKQAVVNEKAVPLPVGGVENYVFFIKDNVILPDSKKTTIVQAKLPKTAGGTSIEEINKNWNAIISALGGEDKTRYAANFKWSDENDKAEGATPKQSGVLKAFGAEIMDKTNYSTTAPKDIWVITASEYAKFHEALAQALKKDKVGPKADGSNAPECKGQAQEPETATECWIWDLDGVKKKVTVNLLKNFLDALNDTKNRMGWRVGLRHTATDPDLKEFTQNVRMADDIPAIEPGLPMLGGKKSFNDYYDKYIGYKAYLIEDSYTENFRKDFVAYYTGTIGELRQLSFEKWEIKQIQETGKYDVNIVYDFKENDTPGKWTIEHPDKPATALSGIGAEYGNNVFLRMPFDAEIGLLSKSRDGYGVGAKETKELGVAQKVRLVDGKGYQKNTFSNTRTTSDNDPKERLQYTRDGNVLSVSKAKGLFEFYPSFPAVADARLGASNSTGFLYELPADLREISGYVLKWRNTENKREAPDKSIPPRTAESFCGLKTAQPVYGFTLAASDATAASYKAYTYLPSQTSVAGLNLKFHCAKGQPANVAGTAIPAEPKATPVTIPVKQYGKSGRYIKEYIELLQGDTICVRKNTLASDNIELYWNTEKLLLEKEVPPATTPLQQPSPPTTRTPS